MKKTIGIYTIIVAGTCKDNKKTNKFFNLHRIGVEWRWVIYTALSILDR